MNRKDWMKYKHLQRDFKIPQVRLLLWLDIFFFRTVGLAYAKCYKIILYLEHGISKQVAFFPLVWIASFHLCFYKARGKENSPLKTVLLLRTTTEESLINPFWLKGFHYYYTVFLSMGPSDFFESDCLIEPRLHRVNHTAEKHQQWVRFSDTWPPWLRYNIISKKYKKIL